MEESKPGATSAYTSLVDKLVRNKTQKASKRAKRIRRLVQAGIQQWLHSGNRLMPMTKLPDLPHVAVTEIASLDTSKMLVDINSANITKLTSLPGIGFTIAQRIVNYRATNGPFVTTEDIISVSGVGEAKFAIIRELIVVN